MLKLSRYGFGQCLNGTPHGSLLLASLNYIIDDKWAINVANVICWPSVVTVAL